VTQNGSRVVPLEILKSLLSKDINFVQIGAWTEKLWLPEVRVSELVFLCFSGEDSCQTGDVAGEPRVARCSQGYPLS
jgi:hypothetical protein